MPQSTSLLASDADVRERLQPVLLGGGAPTYTWLRCFHHTYGLRSVVLASEDTKFISRSKFCDYLRIEDLEQETACVDRLKELGLRLVGEGKVPIVVGSGDWYARILSKHRDELSQWYTVPYVDFGLLDRLSQREGFYAACDRAGVGRPEVWRFDCSVGASPAVPDDLSYPVRLFPTDPIAYRLARLPHKGEDLTAESPAELATLLGELRLSSYDGALTAEPAVAGGDENLRSVACFCDASGTLRTWSTGRVLVEDPLGAGEGSWDCIMLDRDDGLAAQAAVFLKSVGYRGFAQFDACFDARDGSYRFLGVDPHPGRSAFAMNIGGADIAKLLVDEYVLGRTVSEQVACNPGIFTVVPRYVVRRSVQSKPLRRRALSLFDQGKAKNPLFYHADTLTHGFWARVTYLDQIREFRRHVAAAQRLAEVSGERP